MRFCQSFMSELFRHIGPNTDVPAGDIGVGGREIGYLFGQYKRLKNSFDSVLTGKGFEWGGSHIRPEATGYGLVYFAEAMLHSAGHSIKGKRVAISGSGNVAQYAVEKCLQLEAVPVSLSDSGGTIYDSNGITGEKLAFLLDLKNNRRGRIKEYAEKYGCEYYEGKTPWFIKCDIAFPCATQNELSSEDAVALIENGCTLIGEGSNMSCTPEAVELFREKRVLYAPGKASNAGGVAVSGLEMSQNAQRLNWTREEVDAQLKKIMNSIHSQCRHYGRVDKEYIDYPKIRS